MQRGEVKEKRGATTRSGYRLNRAAAAERHKKTGQMAGFFY
jgi:hypothetical protein